MRISALLITLFAVVALVPQTNKTAGNRPSFEDYTVKEIYKGVPVPPQLTKDQRTFRTMIRRGAAVKVQFAGHYTIPMWGCGTGCSVFAVADSISGKVYDGFGVEELTGNWADSRGLTERIEFRPNSRLLKINGCPNEENCGYYDYVMEDGKGLKLVRKELLPKEFQP